ncbi:MAG TPA: DUF2269 family protein [Gemmatimonadales bacterium]|nr:DUF2269 family protein [Gemmatimonadales bacterium]
MHLALAIHLLCFAVLAGGSLGAKVLHGALRTKIESVPAQAAVLLSAMLRFSIVAQIGAGLMLVSGIGLLATEHWGYWGQGWLYVKLALFVLLVINGPLVARPAAMQLLGALESSRSGDAVAVPLKRLEMFHTVQVAGLVGIVLLATLKPF